MSPQSSNNPGSGPSPDVFVGLLFVSVASLIAGITLLIFELRDYGFQLAP